MRDKLRFLWDHYKTNSTNMERKQFLLEFIDSYWCLTWCYLHLVGGTWSSGLVLPKKMLNHRNINTDRTLRYVRRPNKIVPVTRYITWILLYFLLVIVVETTYLIHQINIRYKWKNDFIKITYDGNKKFS